MDGADKPKSGRKRGNGPGWGGPAKGFTPNPNGKRDFNAGTNAQGHTVATPIEAGNRRAARTQQAEALKDVLYDLATNPVEPGGVRVAAANAFIDRVEGKPVATQVTLRTPAEELDDAQLASAIDAIKSAIAGGVEGVGSRAAGEGGTQPTSDVRPLH